jgi:hypothetical protein
MANEQNEEIVFRYSREARLARASEAVRLLNDGIVAKPSFFKTLLSSRANRVAFVAIVIFSVFGLVVRFTSFTSRDAVQEVSVRFGRNTVAVSLFPVEGVLFLGIQKTAPQSGELLTGAVDVIISPAVSNTGTDGETLEPLVFSQRVIFSPAVHEQFQFSLPFDTNETGTDFFVILDSGGEQRAIRLSAN